MYSSEVMPPSFPAILIQRARNVLHQCFWWATLEEDTQEYVSACPTCNQVKSSRQVLSGLLRPLPVTHHPWSHISVDFVTALPPSDRKTGILTIIDLFSKMAHFVHSSKRLSAESAQLLLNHFLRPHGIPVDVVSDRGPQFCSVFWQDFCRLLVATPSLSSGFHPQSNGQTERMNKEKETGLWCTVSQNPSSWSQQLLWVGYAHNNLTSSATGLSPFQ